MFLLKRFFAFTFCVVFLFSLCTVLISCGGGGGGGGGAAGASLSDAEYTTHNTGGWSGGITDNSFGGTNSSTNTSTNTSNDNRNPIYGSTPLSVLSYSDGKKIYNDVESLRTEIAKSYPEGSSFINFTCDTSSGTETRTARITKTTNGVKTSITIDLQYKAFVHVSGGGVQEVPFYHNDGIDLRAYSNVPVAGTTVAGWYQNNGNGGTSRFPVGGDGKVHIPDSEKGDHELSPYYTCRPSLTIDNSSLVQQYGGADTYLYDYAQNTDGVKIRLSQPDLTGCTVTGNIDGGETFTLRGPSYPVDTVRTLLPGQHVITLNVAGGEDCLSETIERVITVYVKPDIKIKETAYIKFFAADNVCKYSYLRHADDMPVEVVSDAATDLASYLTMSNPCFDGSPVTPSTITHVGTHTISADFTGGYCVNPGIKNVSVKIKPVKVQFSGQVRTWNRLYEAEGPCPRHNFYLQAGNPDDEYPEERTFQLNFGDATGVDDGDHARNYYWNSTPSSSNYVWLSAKTSTFYMWTDQAYDYYTTHYMGKINKGDPYTTRTLEDLISNRSFDSEDHDGNGNHDWNAGYRTRIWFNVSLDDSTDP